MQCIPRSFQATTVQGVAGAAHAEAASSSGTVKRASFIIEDLNSCYTAERRPIKGRQVGMATEGGLTRVSPLSGVPRPVGTHGSCLEKTCRHECRHLGIGHSPRPKTKV